MNFERIARCGSRTTCLLFLVANTAAAQQLWTVDDNAPADFVTIQDAVNAAANGDAILVRPGTYSGFQIVGKGVAVIGDSTLKPTVNSAIAVLQTAPGQVVVLARLHQIAPATTGTASGLELGACAGPVRIEGCDFRGQNGPQTGPPGPGVFIVQSPDVVFSASSATGGTGSFGGNWAYAYAWGGGHGIELLGSNAALFQSDFVAGLPGTCLGTHNIGADPGGDGAHVDSSLVYSSGAHLQGGQGGCHSLNFNQCSSSFGYGAAGDGGNGLSLTGGACNVQVQQADLVRGAGGISDCNFYAAYDDGHPGKPFYRSAPGSIAARVLGERRTMSAPAYVSGTSLVDLTATGVAGDLVYVVVESTPHFQFDASLHGVWSLSYPPQTSSVPDAVVSASGSVSFQITLPTLPPSQGAQTHFLQPYVVDLSGQTFAGTPRSVTLAH